LWFSGLAFYSFKLLDALVMLVEPVVGAPVALRVRCILFQEPIEAGKFRSLATHTETIEPAILDRGLR